jgi:CHAD domain-containing protein
VAWRITPDEDLRTAFRRVALEEARRARSALGVPAEGRAEGVHSARRSFKKLRAVLRLARPALGAEFAAENRRWRDLGRKLAPVRDGVVLLQSFDACVKRYGKQLSPDNIARFRADLVAGLAAGLSGDALADVVEEVRTGLDSAQRRFSELPWPDSIACLSEGISESQSRLRRSFNAAAEDRVAERLHEWRKRLKDRTAQIELFRPHLGSEMRDVIKRSKRVADVLGDERDLALLADRLRASEIAASSCPTGVLFVARIEERRAKLSRKAFADEGAQCARAPKQFAREVCESLRRG